MKTLVLQNPPVTEIKLSINEDLVVYKTHRKLKYKLSINDDHGVCKTHQWLKNKISIIENLGVCKTASN